MLRAFLAIAAAFLTAAAGHLMSGRLKKRAEQLELLVMMLEEMTAMLKYRAIRTDEMLAELSASDSFRCFGFLTLLTQLTERGAPLREAWRRAAEEAEFLAENDRGILYRLGERIGATDAEGQLLLLGVSREFAERNLNEALEEYRSKGGVFRRAGLLCGAALGILIL